ncbi:hypothetical protein EYF80_023335 [Liparis tanakae]|uniref:Uncharacterized protein n=1 Tax=Liparis tanakae TaxID=230148 RepID=A0A4Z2HL35_9TELE|nr:hypothetical protein EYF80_023335 [Liparis tanakae]
MEWTAELVACGSAETRQPRFPRHTLVTVRDSAPRRAAAVSPAGRPDGSAELEQRPGRRSRRIAPVAAR